jgi:2,4-didehydro-3-deoxy-L-rhamnonate hydrolase
MDDHDRMGIDRRSVIAGMSAAATVLALSESAMGQRTDSSPAEAPIARSLLPITQGLTLARSLVEGRPHSLAVLAEEGDNVRAVDLSRELAVFPSFVMELFHDRTQDEVLRAIAAAERAGRVHSVRLTDLIVPSAFSGHNPAAALNFPSHSAEARDGRPRPFMFPKVAPTTPWRSRFTRGARPLSDFELEVGVIFDRSIAKPSDIAEAAHGFILLNDMTDRDPLVRLSFPRGLRTQEGLAATMRSKLGADMLQVGPYVVVPRDPKAFFEQVELRLASNGRQRQRDRLTSMTEDVAGLLDRTLADAGAGNAYLHEGKPLRLLPRGVFEPGMVLLTGTPGGTAWRAPQPMPVQNPSAEQIREYVDAYAKAELDSGRYFKAGDELIGQATHLGELVITIA